MFVFIGFAWLCSETQTKFKINNGYATVVTTGVRILFLYKILKEAVKIKQWIALLILKTKLPKILKKTLLFNQVLY